MYIIIPSYQPDAKLITLIETIKASMTDPIILVDDGSGLAYKDFFDQAQTLGVTLLQHQENRGKGAALKTAFSYLQSVASGDEVMITIDSDGQHLVQDMQKVAKETAKRKQELVLGARDFVGKVPFRSRFGNQVTSLVFGLVTGKFLKDTQTGLRGFKTDMIPWLLDLKGDRFEYEFNMLLEAKKAGIGLYEVPIETVYLEENKSSHFRPIQDSIRIYAPILKFSGTAMLSALLDAFLLFILVALTHNLLLSVIVARVASATCQCFLNASFVFQYERSWLKSLIRYALLVLVILAFNYLLLKTMIGIGIGLVIAKILTESFLFLVSYRVQHEKVFV